MDLLGRLGDERYRRAGTTIVYRLAEPTIGETCDIVQLIAERRLGPTASTPARPTTRAKAPLLSS